MEYSSGKNGCKLVRQRAAAMLSNMHNGCRRMAAKEINAKLSMKFRVWKCKAS